MNKFYFIVLMCFLGLAPDTFALIAPPPLSLSSAEKSYQATPVTVHDGKIFIPCQFDSFETTCLLDSGSNFSTVNSKLFDDYKAIGQIQYNGGTGNEITIDKIRIGELKTAHLILKDWPVARLPHYPGYLNLLGLDIFSKTPVLFDFKNLQVIVNPPIPKDLSTVPFISQFGLMLLPVKMGDKELFAVWDTGASYCVVDQGYILNNPSDFSFVKEVQGTDATRTNMPMKLYNIKSLTIGGLTLNNIRVAAMDLSGMRKVYPDFPVFFIGYNIIIQHSWYFDIANYKWKMT